MHGTHHMLWLYSQRLDFQSFLLWIQFLLLLVFLRVLLYLLISLSSYLVFMKQGFHVQFTLA